MSVFVAAGPLSFGSYPAGRGGWSHPVSMKSSR
jgi:hypothetical protein